MSTFQGTPKPGSGYLTQVGGYPARTGYTPSPNRGLASLLYPNGYCVDAALDRVPSRSNLGPDPLGPPSDPSGRTLVDFDDFQDPEDLEFLRFSGSWKEAIQRMCRSGLGGGWPGSTQPVRQQVPWNTRSPSRFGVLTHLTPGSLRHLLSIPVWTGKGRSSTCKGQV